MRALAFPPVLLLVLALPGCLDGGGGLFDRQDAVDPHDYLRGSEYREWHIEVDAVAGFEPRPTALSLLRERMGELAVKDRITVQTDGQLPARSSWTTDDLLALRDAHQDHKTGGSRVVTYVAYVGGAYSEEGEDRLTLGLTIGHDFVVVFKEQVEGACGVRDPTSVQSQDPMDFLPCLGGEERIEKAVLVHEFGHAVGLVDRGIEMVNDHADPEHPRHSRNEASIMYWAVESAGTILEFNTQIPLEFDEDDRRDVCAAGGRCPAAGGGADVTA